MSECCSIGEAQSFIRAAVAGHELVYFTADNSYGYKGLDYCLKVQPDQNLRTVTNIMRRNFNGGFIDLVQRRVAHRTYYLARYRKRRRAVSGFFEVM